MRLVPLLLLALGACSTDPGTSPGTLTKASNINYQCDDEGQPAAYACGLSVDLTGGLLTATSLHRDGTAGMVMATGALTASGQDQIDALIAKLPLDTPAMIHESAGCGGPPVSVDTFSIQFANGTAKDYTFDMGGGVAEQIDDFVLQVVHQVYACSGDSVTLDSCTPNAAPQL